MLNNSFLNYLKRAEFEPVLTKFLDVTELSELINMIGNDYKYLINGGYEDAERVRVIISPDEDVDFSSFEIKIIKIDYPTKFVKINHRNVLGTIMSLGVNRNVIGDIIITSDENPEIYVFVVSEMVSYLENNLLSINNYPVKLKEISPEELINIHFKEGIEKQLIVSSKRLDVIIAGVLNISRNEVNRYFEEKKILINHQVCENRHYECKSSDLISVRKFGRIILDEEVKMTKKNNFVIRVKIWH